MLNLQLVMVMIANDLHFRLQRDTEMHQEIMDEHLILLLTRAIQGTLITEV